MMRSEPIEVLILVPNLANNNYNVFGRFETSTYDTF